MKLLHSGDVSAASKMTIEVLALGSGLVILVELGRSFVPFKFASESILEVRTVD